MNLLIKENVTPADACVIWLHGLGSDAQDMQSLSEQLSGLNVNLRHVYLQAPLRPVTLNQGMVMTAWYDIEGLDFTSRQDYEGIEASEQVLLNAVSNQIESGFTEINIYLAGFSQGAAVALYSALKLPNIAGVIALSGYIPLLESIDPSLARHTPFFIGSGSYDPLVLPLWNTMGLEWLKLHNFSNVVAKTYPMEHSVCYDEIRDISNWFNQHVVRRI